MPHNVVKFAVTYIISNLIIYTLFYTLVKPWIDK